MDEIREQVEARQIRWDNAKAEIAELRLQYAESTIRARIPDLDSRIANNTVDLESLRRVTLASVCRPGDPHAPWISNSEWEQLGVRVRRLVHDYSGQEFVL